MKQKLRDPSKLYRFNRFSVGYGVDKNYHRCTYPNFLLKSPLVYIAFQVISLYGFRVKTPTSSVHS